ncbi:hypothetical protein BDZ45DRAFT_743385 [Acephala macrosclerotiorum]|nr:hypothetical protein BDZ45DRAFT_743385 [Acephala macrosclerotiorum]
MVDDEHYYTPQTSPNPRLLLDKASSVDTRRRCDDTQDEGGWQLVERDLWRPSTGLEGRSKCVTLRSAKTVFTDYYTSYPNLKGYVQDVEDVEQFLRSRLSTMPLHITKITASGPKEPRSPTYDNILAALTTVKINAKPGDFVYIHFSGHGSRLKSSLHPQQPLASNHLHEVLVLEGARHLKDFEPGEPLDDLASKGLFLFVVFDSCHSGGADRVADDNVRGIDNLVVLDAEAAYINKITSARLFTDISEVHKVYVSKEYAIYHRPALGFDSDPIIANIIIDQVGGLRSSAKMLATSNGVELGCLSLKEVSQTQGGSALIYFHSFENYYATYKVLSKECYQISDGIGQLLPNYPTIPADGEAARKIHQMLQKLARYRIVAPLHNKKSKLERSFVFRVSRDAQSEQGTGITETFHGKSIYVEFENFQAADPLANRGVSQCSLADDPRVEFRNMAFEWVPADFVDVYINDCGEMTRQDIQEQSLFMEKLDKDVFGGL